MDPGGIDVDFGDDGRLQCRKRLEFRSHFRLKFLLLVEGELGSRFQSSADRRREMKTRLGRIKESFLRPTRVRILICICRRGHICRLLDHPLLSNSTRTTGSPVRAVLRWRSGVSLVQLPGEGEPREEYGGKADVRMGDGMQQGGGGPVTLRAPLPSPSPSLLRPTSYLSLA
ncbi:hypothetical protein VTG60DRAFT_1720 [Thermothelomyces hinnuleus]